MAQIFKDMLRCTYGLISFKIIPLRRGRVRVLSEEKTNSVTMHFSILVWNIGALNFFVHLYWVPTYVKTVFLKAREWRTQCLPFLPAKLWLWFCEMQKLKQIKCLDFMPCSKWHFYLMGFTWNNEHISLK